MTNNIAIEAKKVAKYRDVVLDENNSLKPHIDLIQG